jgi:hypothetical protein
VRYVIYIYIYIYIYDISRIRVNLLTTELNPSAQRCLPRFLLGILIFKGLTARHLL